MSFSKSSTNISLDGSILRAECSNADGEFVPSELNLDDVLGNINGKFQWGGRAFSQTAWDIRLNDAILEAGLDAGASEDAGFSGPTPASINLDERIGNNNGTLYFTGCELTSPQ